MSEQTGSSSGGGGTTQELFTTIPVDLFRSGNASGPRLDNIRERDVPIKDVLVGKETIRMVESAGGISTFSNYVQKPGVKWWKIPQGTKLPESIRVVKDNYNREMRGTHYSLRPARMMTLAEYAEGLRELALSAIPMFTLPSVDVSSQKKASQK